MGIEKYYLKPTVIKDHGKWNLDIADIILPKYFKLRESWLAYIPPGQFGGNHKHPRREAFIGTNNLCLLWQDNQRRIHKEMLGNDGKLYIVIIQPNVPHVVINISKSASGLLYELADDKQHDVEAVNLIKI